MNRYTFDHQYAAVFRRAGIDTGELLRRSLLPEDLLSRREILLTRPEYFRLVDTLGQMAESKPGLSLSIALSGQIETFSPPVFAACCSSNGRAFLERMARYKRLIGPVQINMSRRADKTRIEVLSDDEREPLPAFFAELELLFLLGLLRKSTQTSIKPVLVETQGVRPSDAFLHYADCDVVVADANALVLYSADLELPFTSRNDAMWQYIEPELRRRLSEMEIGDGMAARVRSALVELLPAGQATIDAVASKLCLSKRTLQRKLASEQTTFQHQLNATRLLLARHYLRNGDHTSDDIAFLLGYEDTTSFLRAFGTWTGQTITEYKRNQK